MLKNYLPEFLYNISDFKDLIDVEEAEFRLLYKLILKIIDNSFIETSDKKTIERLEKIMDISHSVNYSLRVRKDNILAKLRSNITINEEELKRIALAFGCGDIKAKQIEGQYIINIKFISIYGIPEGLEVFKKVLRDVIPAHLDIKYIYSFMTWNEFNNYNKTWRMWNSLNLTWNEFEKYKEDK